MGEPQFLRRVGPSFFSFLVFVIHEDQRTSKANSLHCGFHTVIDSNISLPIPTVAGKTPAPSARGASDSLRRSSVVNSGWTVFTHHSGSGGPKTIELTEEFKMRSKFGQSRIGGKPSLDGKYSFSQHYQADNEYIGRMDGTVVGGDDNVELLNEMNK